jgi:manganese-dependent inorganic pyrophosphatase
MPTEFMRKRFFRSLGILLLAARILSPAAADSNKYAQLFQKIDYGSEVTYIIGHKSPDPDAIGSAIALAELLNAIGIRAVPAAAERIDNESAYALQALGLETVRRNLSVNAMRNMTAVNMLFSDRLQPES